MQDFAGFFYFLSHIGIKGGEGREQYSHLVPLFFNWFQRKHIKQI